MADTKISAMTAAATPLTGAETVPMLQGGANVKSILNNVGDFAISYMVGKTVEMNQLYVDDGSGMKLAVLGDLNGNYFITADNQVSIRSNNDNVNIDGTGMNVNCVLYVNGNGVTFSAGNAAAGKFDFTCNATTGFRMNGATAFTGSFQCLVSLPSTFKTINVVNGLIMSVV